MQSENDAGEMIGEVVGAYRIIEKIGSGGMGAVYLAQHRHLGRKAAVKVLLPEWSSQEKHREQYVARFFDEARAASLVEHPGIVQVLDCDFHPRTGQAYMVLEYLAGMSLRQRLDASRGPAAQSWALRIARGIAEPLAAAHAKGIVHRDLKPDNVFLVDRGGEETVKILDFGIAKLTSAAGTRRAGTMEGFIIGTPRYMSPEQCRGSATVDARADIYALACVLFEILCGRPPFLGEEAAALVAAHLTETPPPVADLVPEVSRGLSALVSMMLAKKPEDRPASMSEVISLLEAVPPVGADTKGTWAAARVGAARIDETAPLPTSRPARRASATRMREPEARPPAPARRDAPAPAPRRAEPSPSRSGAIGLTTGNYWQPGRPRQLLLAVPLVAAAVLGVFLLRDKAASQKKEKAELAESARPEPAPPAQPSGLTPEDLAAAHAAPPPERPAANGTATPDADLRKVPAAATADPAPPSPPPPGQDSMTRRKSNPRPATRDNRKGWLPIE